MSFSPDIYLIGAQKSGTTSLAYLLSQHPDLCLSNPKETHFFSYHWKKKKLDWYQEKFSKSENCLCIDASTTYSMAPLSPDNKFTNQQCFRNIPQRIYSLNPKAKFIYIMRDPVERTYSGYWHYYSKGFESRQFFQAIKSDSFYLDVSRYYDQLCLWLEFFSLDSFLFILFEDMKSNPEKIANQCFRFLKVDPNRAKINFQEARNPSVNYNFIGRKLNRIFVPLNRSGLINSIPFSIRRFFPIRSLLSQMTVDSTKTIPKMSKEERCFLQEYFVDKNRNLESLTGLSLNQWSAPNKKKSILVNP